MSNVGQRILKSAREAHAFASGVAIDGIAVHVLGYEVHLHLLSEEGWWHATVPALPGCASDGGTMVEAVANAARAVAA